MADHKSDIDWRDGTLPVSRRFDDPYYSAVDGLAETRHVFLNGNGLAARLGRPLVIAELGFGTGLNFLATWAAWQSDGARAPLRFVSFEAFPIGHGERRRALEPFRDLTAQADLLCAYLEGTAPGLPEGLSLCLVPGDARETLPGSGVEADAWYLDGFSPAKNPELWGQDLMQAVFEHTCPGGTFATYTAAGWVRRNLEAAGFDVSRAAGFGTKRHMTVGHRP